MIRYYCTQHLDTSLIDFDLDSRSQDCEKSKTMAIMSQSFQSFGMWYTVEICEYDEPHTLFCRFNIQGRELCLCDFVKEKIVYIGLYSDIIE